MLKLVTFPKFEKFVLLCFFVLMFFTSMSMVSCGGSNPIVGHINHAPSSVHIENIFVNEDSYISIDIAAIGNFRDNDTGDVLIFSATGLPNELSINRNTGIISGTIPNIVQDFVYNIQFTATDTGNLTTSQGFTLTYTHYNDAPLSWPFPSINQNESSYIEFDSRAAGNFRDPNPGDILSYSSPDLPSWFLIDSSSGVCKGNIPSVNENTIIYITIVATDPGGLTTQQILKFTINNT